MSDKRFKRSYKISPDEYREKIGAAASNGNGAHRMYHEEAVFCANSLIVGGEAQRYTFDDTHAREGFRTYISGYGRNVLNCYENHWRFRTSSKNEGDELALYVLKVKAAPEEKEQRSYKRPPKTK